MARPLGGADRAGLRGAQRLEQTCERALPDLVDTMLVAPQFVGEGRVLSVFARDQPVRCLVINLPLAWERREAMEHEFGKVGLTCELWPAVDGHRLTDEDHQAIDHDGRRRLGLRPSDSSSAACLLSHLSGVRHLAESEDDMVAIFEDGLLPDDAEPFQALMSTCEQIANRANR